MFVRVVGGLQNRRIGGAQIRVRFLLFDPLAVVVNLLGFLFQHRGGRTAGGSGREDGSTGQILLADGLVALQRQNEIGRFGGIVRRAEDFVLVALEGSNPGVDISGVLLGIVWDATLRGEEKLSSFRARSCSEASFFRPRITDRLKMVVAVERLQN